MKRITDASAKSCRGRTWWKWIVGFAVCLVLVGAVLIGCYCYQRHLAWSELQSVVAKLDKEEPGWRLKEIRASRKRIPTEENGALVVLSAYNKLPTGWFSEFLEHQIKDDLPPTTRLSDKHVGQLGEEMQIVRPTVVEAQKILKFRKAQYNVKYARVYTQTFLPHLQKIRQVVALLQYQVMLEIEKEEHERAWRNALAISCITKSIVDEPFLLSQLVRIDSRERALSCMERTLAHGIVDDKSLAQGQEILADEIKGNALAHGVHGERAGLFAFCESLINGEVRLEALSPMKKGARLKPIGWEAVNQHLVAPRIMVSATWLLEHHTAVIRHARRPLRERVENLHKLESSERSLDATDPSMALASALAPGWTKWEKEDIRSRVRAQCALCALGCERYRQKHNAWPTSLDVVRKNRLIEKVPIDPYDGNPLRYRQTKNGVVVYSIGESKKYRGDALDIPDQRRDENNLEFRLWNSDNRKNTPTKDSQ